MKRIFVSILLFSYSNLLVGCQRTGSPTVLKQQHMELAQSSAEDLFGASIVESDCEMLNRNDILNWFTEHKIDTNTLPDQVKLVLARDDVVALSVHGLPNPYTPGKKTRAADGIFFYLGLYIDPDKRSIMDMEGFWFLGSGGGIIGGPCGGDFCLNCTGYSGYNSATGKYESCVCTKSCKACRACPRC